jgi:hypothetical protein
MALHPRVSLCSTLRPLGTTSNGDGLPVSDDPQVTRPGLQAIKRGFDVSRRRLTRPALADLLDLPRGLQHMEPTERLVVVESGGLSDLPDRMRLARQLAKRRSQSIVAWRRSRLGCSDLWLGDRCSGGPLSRWHGLGGAIARPARSAHDHGPLTFGAGNLELTPAAPRVANGAPTTSALDLGQVFGGWHTPQHRRSANISKLRAARDTGLDPILIT